MDKIYNFIASNGLPVCFIKKTGFETKYAAIGTRYGSSITEYKELGKIHKLKTGLAHFLEHKLFRMEDGSDALEEFSNLNAFANAFTQAEKTTYFFNTTDEFYNPLKLLIKMYFTPVFEKEDIEAEKNIILTEYFESLDDINTKEYYEELNLLYPNDSFSSYVIGTEEDIKNTNSFDLYDAYTAFYTPKNSRLVIVGDLELDKLKEEIENDLDGLDFSLREVEPIKNIKSFNVSNPINYFSYPNAVHILGRIDELDYSYSDSVDSIISIFDSIFSSKSTFYKELINDNLLLNDNIDYSVSSDRFTLWYSIDLYTKYPKEVIDLIINKLKNLDFDDLNEEIINKKIKYIKAKNLYLMDSVNKIGAKVMELMLEDKGYDDLFPKIDIDILKKYLKYIKNSKITYIISK